MTQAGYVNFLNQEIVTASPVRVQRDSLLCYQAVEKQAGESRSLRRVFSLVANE